MAFRKVKLSEIVTILGDGIHGTPKYNENGEYYFINGNNLYNGNIIIKEDTKKVDYEEYEKYKKELNDRTLLVSINGTLGNVAEYKNEKCILGKSACFFNVKEDVNKQFIKYILYSNKFQRYIQEYATGTTIKNMSLKAMREYEFELPEIDIQNKIAKVLSDIDKKIELNNQMNENLHEIVNFIYREMFKKKKKEDFDFLKNHADCILGGTPSRNKAEYWDGNINWINSGEVNRFRILEPTEKITERGLEKSSTVLLPNNTTVLAITGATLGQVSRLEIESCTNQSVVGVVANKDLTNNYIYLTILNNIEDIIKNQTGGAQQHINKGNVEEFKLYIPTRKEIYEFENKVAPTFERISLNCKENIILTNIRDTLLPKLMNGEIDLDKIDI